MADAKTGDTTVVLNPPATTTKTAGADGDADAASRSAADGGSSTEGDKGGGKTGADGKQTPQGAPENYAAFKMPEGFAADEEALKVAIPELKALNATQEQAQKIVDIYAGLMQKQAKAAEESFVQAKTEWREATMKMLGNKADAELVFAAKARDAFADKEAMEAITASGFDNHPAIVRMFIKIGKAIADDTIVDGGKGGGEKTAAEVLYPNQGKK